MLRVWLLLALAAGCWAAPPEIVTESDSLTMTVDAGKVGSPPRRAHTQTQLLCFVC